MGKYLLPARAGTKMLGTRQTRWVLVGMARDLAPADLKAVHIGIGTALRTLHSGVLREEIPDRIAELLRQLDQQLSRLEQRKDAGNP